MPTRYQLLLHIAAQHEMIGHLLERIAHDEPDIAGIWTTKIQENSNLAEKFKYLAANIQKHPVKAEISRKIQNKLGRSDYRIDINEGHPAKLSLYEVHPNSNEVQVFAGTFDELLDWIDEED